MRRYVSSLIELRQASFDTKNLIMTPKQSRMARAALEWSLPDLAEKSGVARITCARFETGKGGAVSPDAVEKMRKALADAGADFTRKAGRVGVTVPE
jgi:transcriptional regulator with XRE-family HTH domain